MLKLPQFRLRSIAFYSKWNLHTFYATRTSQIRNLNISSGIETHSDPGVDDKKKANQSLKNLDTYLEEYLHNYKHDSNGCSLVETFLAIKNRKVKEVIRVGIVYQNTVVAKDSKIIEGLLSDCLSRDSISWFELLKDRLRKSNICFKYGEEYAQNLESAVTCIPSPILSSIYRPSYMKMKDSIPNDIELWEINDATSLNENPDLCHFYVYLVKDMTNALKFPSSIEQKIVCTVVDNQEFSPHSTENSKPEFDLGTSDSHLLKIDSTRLYDGITNFYKYDTKASNNYFDSLSSSNIFQVIKLIGYFLDTRVLCAFLLNRFHSHLLNYPNSVARLNELYTSLRENEIPKFSAFVHSELQNECIPKLSRYFKKSLRWWKLYLKNDNVEYDLIDLFNKDFMNKSIENYNFFRGKILTKMQQNQYLANVKTDVLDNPLQDLKENILTKKIPLEVQPMVYKSITSAFGIYQLPISIISALSFQYCDFSFNAAFSLFLLGWVVGFSHMSKVWEAFCNDWLTSLFEEVRLCAGRDCIENGLLKELESKHQREILLIDFQKELIEIIEKLRY